MSDVVQDAAVRPAEAVVDLALGRSEPLLAKQLVAAAGDRRVDGVLVDLSAAEAVGSLLLTSLRAAGEILQERGGGLIVVCDRPSLADFVRLMLLDRALAVVGGRREARLP